MGNDGRPVFIVFDKISDAKFIINTLENANNYYEKNQKYLFGRHYKIVLLERDSKPGRFITDNINELIQESCRTIMILTPDYLESHFYLNVFHTAENLQKLIVIKLLPTNEEEKIMKNLLNQEKHTSLKNYCATFKNMVVPWKGSEVDRKFWKRLSFLLPHQQVRLDPTPVPLIPPITPRPSDIQADWYYPNIDQNRAAGALYLFGQDGHFLVIDSMVGDFNPTNTDWVYTLLVLTLTPKRSIFQSQINRISVLGTTHLRLDEESPIFKNLVDLITHYKNNPHPDKAAMQCPYILEGSQAEKIQNQQHTSITVSPSVKDGGEEESLMDSERIVQNGFSLTQIS